MSSTYSFNSANMRVAEILSRCGHCSTVHLGARLDLAIGRSETPIQSLQPKASFLSRFVSRFTDLVDED